MALDTTFSLASSDWTSIFAWGIDFILHIDQHLQDFVSKNGNWIYALLFLIIFVETGVVLMPFLPGDSLLFVAGAMCGVGLMDWSVTVSLLWCAAVLGNQSNYAMGRWLGPKAFGWKNARFFNANALLQAQNFYEKHGVFALVAARFLPFLRTFAPFVAGIAKMNRATFTACDILSGGLWVVGIVSAGYFFGNVPWVKLHLDKIIWAMILVPAVLVLIGSLKKSKTVSVQTHKN